MGTTSTPKRAIRTCNQGVNHSLIHFLEVYAPPCASKDGLGTSVSSPPNCHAPSLPARVGSTQGSAGTGGTSSGTRSTPRPDPPLTVDQSAAAFSGTGGGLPPDPPVLSDLRVKVRRLLREKRASAFCGGCGDSMIGVGARWAEGPPRFMLAIVRSCRALDVRADDGPALPVVLWVPPVSAAEAPSTCTRCNLV
jgi:hypothetical protein